MKEILALRDVLSKNVNDEKRGTFIEEFDSLLAKHDTSDVWRQFAIWMLVDPEYGVIKFTKPDSEAYHTIQRVAQLYIDNCKDAAEWEAAARTDYDFNPGISGVIYNFTFYAFRPSFFAYTACSVSASAAVAMAASYAVAAYCICAADAAYSVRAAADAVAAARDAYEASAYAERAAAAGKDHVRRMADKLLELMKASPEVT